MGEVLAELKYSKTHEWVRIDDEQRITIGITDHAQDALGDIVFIETPEIGARIDADESCAAVESVKSASDIYSPAGGEIIAINDQLEDSPEQVNQSPYADGWIYQMRIDDAGDLSRLMDADEYARYCEELD